MLWDYLKYLQREAPSNGVKMRDTSLVEERDSLDKFPSYDGVRAWTQVMTGMSAFSKTMRMAWDQSVGDANLYSY